MINIYTVISKLTPIYLELANKYTNDINEANDSVQDLVVYQIKFHQIGKELMRLVVMEQ